MQRGETILHGVPVALVAVSNRNDGRLPQFASPYCIARSVALCSIHVMSETLCIVPLRVRRATLAYTTGFRFNFVKAKTHRDCLTN